MTAKRRWTSGWLWAAALVVGLAAAAAWDAHRGAVAQDAAEPPRERFSEMSLSERREKIRNMSPARKERLAKDEKRLAKLDPVRQKQLRDLAKQVEEDPHADDLLQVMRRYYDWLRAHPEAQLELAGLSPEGRVEKIKEMLIAEDAGPRTDRGFGFPPSPRGDAGRRMSLPLVGRGGILRGEDTEGVLKWQEKYVKEHGSELLLKISSPFREQLQKQLEGATDELHRYEVLGMILLRWQLENPAADPLTDDDLKELRQGLSEATLRRLDAMPVADQRREQWRIASGLIYRFMLSQAAARHATSLSPVVSEEELAEFFQNNIGADERARLLKEAFGADRAGLVGHVRPLETRSARGRARRLRPRNRKTRRPARFAARGRAL